MAIGGRYIEGDIIPGGRYIEAIVTRYVAGGRYIKGAVVSKVNFTVFKVNLTKSAPGAVISRVNKRFVAQKDSLHKRISDTNGFLHFKGTEASYLNLKLSEKVKNGPEMHFFLLNF